MDTIAIKSNRIVLPGKVFSGYLVIQNGVISDIVSHIPDDYTRLIDVTEKVLMPGVVDPHVHINEPGRTEWEGFDTATKAALAGGITSLVEMPLNSSPVTTSGPAYQEKIRTAQGRIHCNCSFWGGIIPGNADELEPMIDMGVKGFKAFLIDSGIEEFPAVTEADLRKVMPILAKNGKPLLVHCELESLVSPSGTPIRDPIRN